MIGTVGGVVSCETQEVCRTAAGWEDISRSAVRHVLSDRWKVLEWSPMLAMHFCIAGRHTALLVMAATAWVGGVSLGALCLLSNRGWGIIATIATNSSSTSIGFSD